MKGNCIDRPSTRNPTRASDFCIYLFQQQNVELAPKLALIISRCIRPYFSNFTLHTSHFTLHRTPYSTRRNRDTSIPIPLSEMLRDQSNATHPAGFPIMTDLYAWNTARAGSVAYPNVRGARLFHPTRPVAEPAANPIDELDNSNPNHRRQRREQRQRVL
uniref:Uncharacterized protein n=1 Tax=Candidatus Kentrum sp. FM TaxID=2126340 RepID=A0A450VNI3_9GAMM|nr:MAG: hypothetical protein BECKFM1743B_GA0114221_1001416 [Candidatus Kentron sp. FM]